MNKSEYKLYIQHLIHVYRQLVSLTTIFFIFRVEKFKNLLTFFLFLNSELQPIVFVKLNWKFWNIIVIWKTNYLQPAKTRCQN